MSALQVPTRSTLVGETVEVALDGAMVRGTVETRDEIRGLILLGVAVADGRATDGEGSLVTVVIEADVRHGFAWDGQDKKFGMFFVQCWCGERFTAAVRSDLADAHRRLAAHVAEAGMVSA